MTEQLIERATCSALIITCSDFRFKSAERAFAEGAGLTDDYDLIARPGAIRALVAPRTTAARHSLREDMRLLWSIHHFSRVLMVHHVSCAAYADLTAGKDEITVHTAHLLRARGIVEDALSGVRAEPYIVQLADGVLQAKAVEADPES
jgi:hypothetical protein